MDNKPPSSGPEPTERMMKKRGKKRKNVEGQYVSDDVTSVTMDVYQGERLTSGHSSTTTRKGSRGKASFVNKDDHLALKDDLETEGLEPQNAKVRKQKKILQTDNVEVRARAIGQKTSDGALAAECTKDTEHTEATAGELYTHDGKGRDRSEVETVYEGQDEEITLRDHYKRCRKSARHLEYIPVPDFCMEHLPTQYRTERVLALVRAEVKLTVLLKVSVSSEKQHEYFPGTHRNAIRRGSGRVVWVTEYPNEGCIDVKCRCDECQTSGKPRHSFAEIRVVTAAHVVYDFKEGRNTECYFDFDSDSVVLSSCPTLKTAVYVWVDARRDVSLVIFITHDLDLARRLKETVKTYKRLCGEIRSEHGVELEYDSEDNLLENITILSRSCQKVVEECSEWINRWRNMTTAEAELRLEEYKSKHKVQPGDELSDYGGILEARIRDADEWRQELSLMNGRYEEFGRCLTGVRDLEENFQSCVQQHGVQWAKVKYEEYRVKLKDTIESLAGDVDDASFDVTDLLYYNRSHPLTVIVSHPHGFRKQISIGQVTDRNCDMGYDRARYIYTATTCPGSSGAPVYILGRVGDRGNYKTCTHSGGCDTLNTNKSTVVDDC